MKINRSNFLFLFLLVTCLSAAPVFSEVLSDQALKNDIKYYQSVSKQKNLSANDRTYILKRIEDKYAGSDIDTAPLQRELQKAASGSGHLSAQKPKPNRKGSTKPSSKTGIVEKIFISETKTQSRVIVASSGATRSSYSLLRDPNSPATPKIVLDLFGVKNKLKKTSRSISPQQGLYSNVSTEQLAGPPDNIVQVIATLREDVPYTVKKEGQLWVISAEKNAVPQQQKTETAPSAPITNVPSAVTIAPSAAPAAAPGITSPAPTDKSVPVVVDSTQTESAAPATEKPSDAFEKTSKNVADDYLIENSDILGITIYPTDELSREVVVQPDGNISFPLIGSIQARGLTIKKLEANLAQNLGRYISSPQVSISIKQFSRRQIFITGEAKGVGAYSYKENLRLLEFISSIGGFTDTANRSEVKIYRGPPTKRQIHLVNVEEIVKSGDFSKDFLLEPGDIIEVQKGQAKISILGDIRTPGYYDFKENMHLIELVSLAGGFNDSAKITDVSIINQGSDNNRTVLKVDFKKILSGKDKDVLLHSGVTVYFPKGKMESANYFLNTILPWLSLVALVLAIRGGV